MPFNLLKVYNELLDIVILSPRDRIISLRRVFNRDIQDNPNFNFRGKPIDPTVKDGEIPMDTLFSHLTTKVIDEKTKERQFENDRSIRIHWIKYHVEESKAERMHIFSVKEKGDIKTYIYDEDEKYVIVLELRNNRERYFLLTAYHLRGKDDKRDKILKKKKRALDEVY